MAVDPNRESPLDKYRRQPASKTQAEQQSAKETIPLEGETPPASSVPDETPHACYAAFSDGLAYTVDYVFLNGSRRAIAYGYLTEVRIDPSEGIEVRYTGPVVSIRGRNLMPIYEALRTQRAYRIIEIDARFGLSDADTAVTAIEVKEGE